MEPECPPGRNVERKPKDNCVSKLISIVHVAEGNMMCRLPTSEIFSFTTSTTFVVTCCLVLVLIGMQNYCIVLALFVLQGVLQWIVLCLLFLSSFLFGVKVKTFF